VIFLSFILEYYFARVHAQMLFIYFIYYYI